jgi:hypothetical protein
MSSGHSRRAIGHRRPANESIGRPQRERSSPKGTACTLDALDEAGPVIEPLGHHFLGAHALRFQSGLCQKASLMTYATKAP